MCLLSITLIVRAPQNVHSFAATREPEVKAGIRSAIDFAISFYGGGAIALTGSAEAQL
jgi:hypothetical protein